MGWLDFPFPRRCLGCNKVGRYFCSGCLPSVKPPKASVCPFCFRSSIYGAIHTQCRGVFSLDGLVTVFKYEGMIQQAIKKLKYRFITDLAEEMVNLIIKHFREGQGRFFPKFDGSWILTPVPLYFRRERWRGFNQAQILGEKIAGMLNLRFNGQVLIRRKYTQPQAEIREIKDRYANIRGAFKINPILKLRIPNSKFILFDDVWTTGSTIKECARVLKKTKAVRVWGMTMAR
ncbi:MAG TPA: ComF family protein [Candidatus Bathyarchaeia archaeon]|nr:ComF family protein [Candidatus Bathyarchaeia archaeon]